MILRNPRQCHVILIISKKLITLLKHLQKELFNLQPSFEIYQTQKEHLQRVFLNLAKRHVFDLTGASRLLIQVQNRQKDLQQHIQQNTILAGMMKATLNQMTAFSDGISLKSLETALKQLDETWDAFARTKKDLLKIVNCVQNQLEKPS